MWPNVVRKIRQAQDTWKTDHCVRVLAFVENHIKIDYNTTLTQSLFKL